VALLLPSLVLTCSTLHLLALRRSVLLALLLLLLLLLVKATVTAGFTDTVLLPSGGSASCTCATSHNLSRPSPPPLMR
jgi:hypothetical protein